MHGEAMTYLSPKLPLAPTLSFRVGGKKLWGDFPWFESAFIGDRQGEGADVGQRGVHGVSPSLSLRPRKGSGTRCSKGISACCKV